MPKEDTRAGLGKGKKLVGRGKAQDEEEEGGTFQCRKERARLPAGHQGESVLQGRSEKVISVKGKKKKWARLIERWDPKLFGQKKGKATGEERVHLGERLLPTQKEKGEKVNSEQGREKAFS